MRSGLIDGKFVPPKSLAAAVSRRRRMAAEIKRMWLYLDRQVSANATLGEQQRTHDAISRFQAEAEPLDAWIAMQKDVLLRDARVLIKTLERDGTDFSNDEVQLIHRLDAFFAALDEPLKPAKKKR